MRIRPGLIVLAAAALVVGMSTMTQAFHHGGVAECIGCHSMHAGTELKNLLIGSDPSSTCMNCHVSDAVFEHGSSYHMVTDEGAMGVGVPPKNYTPGGDFAWLKKTYTWNPGWGDQTEKGQSHGHNIVATDFSYNPDPDHAFAPGSNDTYSSADLGCNSCHDPHGQYRRLLLDAIANPGDATSLPIKDSGSYESSPAPDATAAVGVYRILGGFGYDTGSGGLTFDGVPQAVTPDDYNRTEEGGLPTRVAYGFKIQASEHEGWAEWCGTCHENIHDFATATSYRHPVDYGLNGTTNIDDNYNAYVETGDLSGVIASSFNSLVPFATTGDSYADLQLLAKSDGTALGGPAQADLVSCLSCHRAHASGWEYAMRWNPESELLTYNGNYPDAGTPGQKQYARGRTDAEITAAYYGRPATEFANYQRSLCNKCHIKD